MTCVVEISIDFEGFEDKEVDVEYHFDGKFIAQTYWQPEEYPELVLDAVKLGDVDILGEITDSDFEVLYLLAMQAIELAGDDAEEWDI